MIFDNHLTFNYHKEETLKRCKRTLASLYKFSKEIKMRSIMIRLFFIFVLPIIEYGIQIWINDENSTKINDFERLLRNVTRYAYNLPFLPNSIGYQSYNERLRRCKKISIRNQSSILLMTKIFKGEIKSQYQNVLLQELNTRCVN